MIALAPATAAPPAAGAAQREVVRPVSRVFPFLDLYYRLGAAKRTLFTVAYRWRAVAPDSHSWRPVEAVLETGAGASPIAHSPLGWLDRDPTPSEYAARPAVRLSFPAGWRLAMILAPQLSAEVGARMAPGELVAAADQFERGVHAAGPLAVAIPHFTRVLFVGAQGGSVVDAQGRETPLAPVKGEVFASVSTLRDAAALRFDTPPERVLLLPG